MVAPSRIPAVLNPATNTHPAAAAPTEIAAANIPTFIAPSPVVVDSPTLTAGATLKTLIVPPASTSSFVAAAVTYNGQKFSINPSEFIAPTATIALTAQSQVVVYQGQSFTLNPSQFVAPGTIIPIPAVTASPILSPVTVGSIIFSLGPSAAIIRSSTYLFSPGQPPLTTVLDGQTIHIGANGIGFASTTVAIPTGQTAPTILPVVADGIKIEVGSNNAIISGTTYAIGSGATPQTVVIGTETLTFGPSGVGLPSTTILPYYPPPAPSPVAVDGLTFSIDAIKAIISGTTYAIGSGATPQTVVIGTETLTFGPSGVGLPSTTILPYYPPTAPSPVVVDGLTFSIDATEAIISGTTYAIGPGAVPKTVVIGTETLTFGPNGVDLPSTTIPPYYPPTIPSPVIIDGLTFSIDATQAIISGTTYAIGPGAVPKTVVIGTETLTFGPGGVDLPSTTIPPYYPPTIPSPVIVDGLTFSIDATEAIISGTTYAIGPDAVPKTVVIGTETLTFGPNGVDLPSTTIPPYKPPTIPSPVIIDGLTFSIDATEAIISGTTYAIGPGAVPETIVLGSETISIGPGGVGLPHTTLVPPSLPSLTPTPVTADGLTFSIDASDVIIAGSTYAIGSGAPTETLLVAGETVVVGPGGVGLVATTLAPPGAAGTGLEVSTGAAAVSRPVVRLVGGFVCFLLGVLVL
ncbi:hypothetical protein LPUS_06078 [Lasallia pustulata]|uniref:Uncharacterized protein n=1 Tax=Lasallia pustulata TaxID=136370 RepID=A0A1W5D0K3_9LECA|nr:hypothetical protein LPUS_06078 [Lasallia pustulata]